MFKCINLKTVTVYKTYLHFCSSSSLACNSLLRCSSKVNSLFWICQRKKQKQQLSVLVLFKDETIKENTAKLPFLHVTWSPPCWAVCAPAPCGFRRRRSLPSCSPSCGQTQTCLTKLHKWSWEAPTWAILVQHKVSHSVINKETFSTAFL